MRLELFQINKWFMHHIRGGSMILHWAPKKEMRPPTIPKKRFSFGEQNLKGSSPQFCRIVLQFLNLHDHCK